MKEGPGHDHKNCPERLIMDRKTDEDLMKVEQNRVYTEMVIRELGQLENVVNESYEIIEKCQKRCHEEGCESINACPRSDGCYHRVELNLASALVWTTANYGQEFLRPIATLINCAKERERDQFIPYLIKRFFYAPDVSSTSRTLTAHATALFALEETVALHRQEHPLEYKLVTDLVFRVYNLRDTVTVLLDNIQELIHFEMEN